MEEIEEISLFDIGWEPLSFDDFDIRHSICKSRRIFI